MHDFAAYRQNMIESQIRPNQVTNGAVLAVFAEIPREAFVPDRLKPVAYIDESVPLGGDRYLVEPRVAARLVQALAVEPTDKALLVGAASGYMAAILSRLAAEVTALEIDGKLAAEASANVRSLGLRNVTVVQDDLRLGYAGNAPYEVILCDGAVTVVPPALADQLAEGGRLATVTTRADGTAGHGILSLKTHGSLSHRILFDAVTPLLPGCAPEPAFVF
jgi:protein-L-isoaspartate(D-aspartate) O-methyltransferase